jgi:hypothetical protein
VASTDVPSMAKAVGRAHMVLNLLEKAGVTDADFQRIIDDTELRGRVARVFHPHRPLAGIPVPARCEEMIHSTWTSWRQKLERWQQKRETASTFVVALWPQLSEQEQEFALLHFGLNGDTPCSFRRTVDLMEVSIREGSEIENSLHSKIRKFLVA